MKRKSLLALCLPVTEGKEGIKLVEREKAHQNCCVHTFESNKQRIL